MFRTEHCSPAPQRNTYSTREKRETSRHICAYLWCIACRKTGINSKKWAGTADITTVPRGSSVRVNGQLLVMHINLHFASTSTASPQPRRCVSYRLRRRASAKAYGVRARWTSSVVIWSTTNRGLTFLPVTKSYRRPQKLPRSHTPVNVQRGARRKYSVITKLFAPLQHVLEGTHENLQ